MRPLVSALHVDVAVTFELVGVAVAVARDARRVLRLGALVPRYLLELRLQVICGGSRQVRSRRADTGSQQCTAQFTVQTRRTRVQDTPLLLVQFSGTKGDF